MRWKLPFLWKAGGPDNYVWGFGFWSSGPESLPGDGLLTYHNLEGESEMTREKDLVILRSTALSAVLDWFKVRVFGEKNG